MFSLMWLALFRQSAESAEEVDGSVYVCICVCLYARVCVCLCMCACVCARV